MYNTYVLKSISHGNRYVGSTEDLKSRIVEHNKGRCRYTKGRIPWTLIYSEEFSTLSEARKRELFLKSGKGREFLDKILANK
ncbi:MAG: GIY-YIG nuclease family protein [Patescibacteria group bacterium]